MADYTEIYNDTRSYLRQPTTALSDADLTVLHRRLAHNLTEEHLPAMKAHRRVEGQALLDGYTISDIAYIEAVFSPDGRRLAVEVVERTGDFIDGHDYVVIVGNRLTGYGLTPGDNYTLSCFNRYAIAAGDADDLILLRHRHLLQTGLVAEVMKWQEAESATLALAVGEYHAELEKASRDDMTFWYPEFNAGIYRYGV